ncbi:hypothetical protein G6F58_013130 [Rhizopus delemar]|nr:hypothetical protein G6F59_016672 [Rhizopus arrhizus]KAG1389987.1 hypothetical protein G6F58_013130 [Rhizopus delemar]
MCIVCTQQRFAVEEDLRIGIEPIEAQLGIGLGKRRGIHVETGAVFPVGQADPLQLGLGCTDVGIADQRMGQQIGPDAPHPARRRAACGTPTAPAAGLQLPETRRLRSAAGADGQRGKGDARDAPVLPPGAARRYRFQYIAPQRTTFNTS